MKILDKGKEKKIISNLYILCLFIYLCFYNLFILTLQLQSISEAGGHKRASRLHPIA